MGKSIIFNISNDDFNPFKRKITLYKPQKTYEEYISYIKTTRNKFEILSASEAKLQ